MKMKYNYLVAMSCGLTGLFLSSLQADDADSEKITIEVVVDSIQATEETGKTTMSAEDIQLQGGGGESINDIAFTMTNVQFDNSRGELSESSILDIRPSQISISGGRTYDNNFVVDGVSTNSLSDSTNNNIHNISELVGHPQTVFVNPALIDRITVYDSDIPAEFGGFGGGVFSITTRDPSGELHFGATYGFKSDATTEYLLNDDFEGTDVAKPLYEKSEISFYADVPLTEQDAVLFSYSKVKSVLENTQPHQSFSYLERGAESVTENYSLKYQHLLNDVSKLVFSSLYAPSEMQNYEQSLKIQNNDGWANSIRYVVEDVDFIMEAIVGYSISDSGRLAEETHFSFRNTDSVDWVSDDRSSGSVGGFGVLNQEQEDIPLSISISKVLSNEASLSFGGEYRYQSAFKERPEDNYSYNRGNEAENVVSAEGPDDPTVIDGEQALKQYNLYQAYRADVSLNTFSTWGQYLQSFDTDMGEFTLRAGLRLEYSDFLSNLNLGPRLLGSWQANDWLKLSAGYARYYTADKISYKIRESYPDSYIYRRVGTEVDGQLVYSNDNWELYRHSVPANYSQSDLDTPYSDEFSLSAFADGGNWGLFQAKLLKREGRDEFSRSASERITYDRESGGSSFYNSFTVTNEGYSDYRSVSIKWIKEWKNNRLELNSTLSDTETTNVDYFDEFDEEEQEEIIYYAGEIVPYYEMKVKRENMADPFYINLIWTSRWWDDRLQLNINGRWTDSYEAIMRDGTITVDDVSYDQYIDYTVPSKISLNANARVELYDNNYGSYSFIAKVYNVLNEVNDLDVSSADPYEQGRTFWLGLDYNY